MKIKRMRKRDVAWKEIVERYLPNSLAIGCPELYESIDWSLGIESKNKELPAIYKDSETRDRFVDNLFEVTLKNKEKQLLYIHVESQDYYDKDFQERMFIYGYRIFDRYKKRVVALAILTDDNQSWRPSLYQDDPDDPSFIYRFHLLKVIDYRGKEAELSALKNPFAEVLLVQLARLELEDQKDPQSAFQRKLALTRHLYQKGFSSEDIYALFQFIDVNISLPEELEIKFDQAVLQEGVSNNMMPLSGLELRAIARGKIEGKREGKREGKVEGLREGEASLLSRLLTRKHGQLTPEYVARLAQASSEQLLLWSERILSAKTLEEVFLEPTIA